MTVLARAARSRWPELPVELAIAAVVAATTVLAVWTELRWSPYPIRAAGWAYACAAVAAGALVARRRRPVAVLAVGVLCLLAYHLAGYPGGGVAMMLFVACYSVPAYAHTRWRFAACASCVVLLVVILAVPPHRQAWYSFALLGPAFGLGWMAVLGAAARARRVAAEAYVRRAELQLREGLAEERLRIARELHDILAHTISVIAVQAGVALDSLDTAPAEARAAMLRVRAVAAGARPELRAALGLLRAEGSTPDMLAQPGLDELGDLVATSRAAGLRTTLAVADDLPALPAFTQLTVYRIAQEALTNVVRHARAGEATVSLRVDAGDLLLRVRDDGQGSSGGPGHGGSGGPGHGASGGPGHGGSGGPGHGASGGPGHGDGGGLGIAGMRERVQLLGGTLRAAPAPEGGFLLEARIPVEAA